MDSATDRQGKAEEWNLLIELRRWHLDELAGGALPDLADPLVMDSAWGARWRLVVPDLQLP